MRSQKIAPVVLLVLSRTGVLAQSKGGKELYAIVLEIPKVAKIVIKTLASNLPNWPGEIRSVQLVRGDRAVLGHQKLEFTRAADGIHVILPKKNQSKIALALVIR